MMAEGGEPPSCSQISISTAGRCSLGTGLALLSPFCFLNVNSGEQEAVLVQQNSLY